MTEYRLSRELRGGERCDSSIIHEKRRKRSEKYRLKRELCKFGRYNGTAIPEKRRKRLKKHRLKRHMISPGGASAKMLFAHQIF